MLLLGPTWHSPSGEVEGERAVSMWGHEAQAMSRQAWALCGRAKRSAGAGVRTRVFVRRIAVPMDLEIYEVHS
jgi:hypothetical protein